MFLWRVSRYCEEFHCTPPVAKRELEEDPERMGEQILQLRAYAAAKRAYDDHCERGSRAGELPTGPFMAEVVRNDFLVKQRRAAQRRSDADDRG